MAKPATYSSNPRRVGKDELNFSEFPIAYLGGDGLAPARLEFRDGDKSWIVSGDPVYGLPTTWDVDMYLVLMEQSRLQAFAPEPRFTRYDLCKRLGLEVNGKNYQRIKLSMDRWVSVTIRTTNAFWDRSIGKHLRHQAFHVLDAYDFTERHDGSEAQAGTYSSWFRWSTEIQQSIAAKYIKSIDLDFCLSLKQPVTKQLFRYLDAKRGGDKKRTYRIGVAKLCHEHLGISRSARYFSHLRQRLDPANEALAAAGFLGNWEYLPTQKGEQMVSYTFGCKSGRPKRTSPTPSALAPQTTSDDGTADLIRRMVEAGVWEKDAMRLAQSDPSECERKLLWLKSRTPKNPGAWLYSAITERWEEPRTSAASRRTDAAIRRQIRENVAVEREARSISTARKSWQEHLDSMSTAERDALRVRAETEIREDPELWKSVNSSPAVRRHVYDERMQRLSGWQP